eukprot:6762798-Prymnesium_polylepis.1
MQRVLAANDVDVSSRRQIATMIATGVLVVTSLAVISHSLLGQRTLAPTDDWVRAVVGVARGVYTEHFSNTIIGDCDFGCSRKEKDPSSPRHCETRAAHLCPRPMGNGCTMAQ